MDDTTPNRGEWLLKILIFVTSQSISASQVTETSIKLKQFNSNSSIGGALKCDAIRFSTTPTVIFVELRPKSAVRLRFSGHKPPNRRSLWRHFILFRSANKRSGHPPAQFVALFVAASNGPNWVADCCSLFFWKIESNYFIQKRLAFKGVWLEVHKSVNRWRWKAKIGFRFICHRTSSLIVSDSKHKV